MRLIRLGFDILLATINFRVDLFELSCETTGSPIDEVEADCRALHSTGRPALLRFETSWGNPVSLTAVAAAAVLLSQRYSQVAVLEDGWYNAIPGGLPGVGLATGERIPAWDPALLDLHPEAAPVSPRRLSGMIPRRVITEEDEWG